MPVQWAHGEVVVASVVNGKLLPEVFKGMEPVGSIEILVVFSVRTFYLAVMPRRIGTDEFMPYPQLFEASLKE